MIENICIYKGLITALREIEFVFFLRFLTSLKGIHGVPVEYFRVSAGVMDVLCVCVCVCVCACVCA